MSSRPDPFLAAVCALGVTQITAWGTSYYCLGVLANPIARDTGWSLSLIYFGFTVSLLTMGAVSAWAGKAIDAYGARAVMSTGTVLVSAGLLLLSLVTSEAAYLAVWAFLGLGMRLCLYDAAFAALVQVVPSRGRLAISYLTLFGAFASTVFWVVGHYLNESFGWRSTLLTFAAINLAICLPLNWLGLSRHEAKDALAAPAAEQAAPQAAPLAGRLRTVAIALFALVMSLNGFVFGVVTVQLVPLLEAAGLATAAAVWVASMKGFAQFGGRVVEIFFARNLHAMTVARIAIGAGSYSGNEPIGDWVEAAIEIWQRFTIRCLFVSANLDAAARAEAAGLTKRGPTLLVCRRSRLGPVAIAPSARAARDSDRLASHRLAPRLDLAQSRSSTGASRDPA